MLKSILLATMLTVVGATATASEFTVDGIKYNVTDSVAKTVEVIANNYQYDITIPEAVTPDTTTWTVTAIGKDAFRSCNVSTVTLPNSVTEIGQYAFSESKLISISLSNTLETIQGWAFEYCKNLTEIILPNSITTIGEYAFFSSKLFSIEIPEKVVAISPHTFRGCNSLSTVKLAPSVIEIGANAFSDCSNLEYIEAPEIKRIGSSAFSNCSRLQKITIPNTLVELGLEAFIRCPELTEITLPDNITTINDNTFRDCSKLGKVKLPKNLITLRSGSFYGCKSLTEIAIPTKTTELHGSNFNVNTTLKKVFIPSSVKSISALTFSSCDSLQEIHIRHTNPINIGSNVFRDNNVFYTDISKCTLYVPKGCTEAYMSADVWKDFGAIVEEGLSIKLEETKTLIVGMTSEMTKATTPSVFPSTSITWSSSNDAVATVDENGFVTAIAEGTATITATMSLTEGLDTEQASSSCVLTVKASPTDFFTVENGSAFTNSSVYLPVSMTNEKNITAFQCDIILPNGVSLVSIEDEYDFLFAGRESRTHSITSELQADGSVRVVAFSSKNSAFDGNSGELFTIPLLASDNTGDFNIWIKNIILVDDSNNEQATTDVNFWLTVKDYLHGDANIDNKVTISDATTTVSYILGETPEPFLLAAADVTADGSVTINDVTGIINIVLGTAETTSTLSVKDSGISTKETSVDGDRIYINDFVIGAGETKDIEICMANSAAYTAFQCDIYLPEGLSFLVEDDEYIVDLSDRKSRSHTIATSLQPDGALRVVAFSSKNANFTGNDGALMILPIVAGENVGSDLEMSVKNNLFVSENVEYTFPEITAKINNSTSVANISSDNDTQIYVDGHTLYIATASTGQMQLYTIDGRSTTLKLSQGLNSFNIENKGIYIIDGHKIVIK